MPYVPFIDHGTWVEANSSLAGLDMAVIDDPRTMRDAQVEIGPPPRQPRPVPLATPSGKDKPRWATAAGDTGDNYCHWYVNRGRTLCGKTHPMMERSAFHRQAPCPNGNPPCPTCHREYAK